MTSFPCPLAEAARQWPERPAIITTAGSLSFNEYDARVRAAASHLRDHGVTERSRVAIISENSLDYVIALMALLRLRAVACPISTAFPPDLLWSLPQLLGAGLVLASEPGRVRPAQESVPVLQLTAVMNASRAASAEDPPVHSAEDPATIVLTSGSSGKPKPAMLSFGNHYYSALGSNTNIAVAPGDRWLLTLPLAHVGGLAILFRCLLAGAAVVLPDSPKVDADYLREHRITHLSVVPLQLRRILDSDIPPQTFPHLKAVLMGGAAPPKDLVREAWQKRLPLHLSYGLTEMASQVTTTRASDRTASPPDSAGPVLPHREVTVGPEGEILVRGETRFLGYVEGPRLHLPVDREGWFHTGDIGCFTEDGCLIVEGRRDDRFISGGENVYPRAIEDALRSFNCIADAVVVSVADPGYGRRPFAFVELTPENTSNLSQEAARLREYVAANRGGAPVPAEIRDILRKYLPAFALPVAIATLPEEGRETMKRDRRQLATLAAESYRRFAT